MSTGPYEGVVRGFQQTLEEAATERSTSEAPTAARHDVVEIDRRLAEHERRVLAFVHWHHPRVRTHRVGGRGRDSAAFERGQVEGRSLRVQRPLAGGDGGPPRRITGGTAGA